MVGHNHHQPGIPHHGTRLLASSKGVILPAEKLGKHKTAWQMITIVSSSLYLPYETLASKLTHC